MRPDKPNRNGVSNKYLLARNTRPGPRIMSSLTLIFPIAHALDLVVGHTVRFLGGGCSGFVIEEHIQVYPYSLINPDLCR